MKNKSLERKSIIFIELFECYLFVSHYIHYCLYSPYKEIIQTIKLPSNNEMEADICIMISNELY